MNKFEQTKRKARDAEHHFAIRNQKGATVVFVAVLFPALVAFAALAIDIGYAMLTRNEVQNVADAGALAGTRKLGVIYEEMTPAQQQSYVCNPATIVPIVQETGLLNRAGQKDVIINAADVEIGTWEPSRTPKFIATMERPNAVQVKARRDGSANGPITTFFARIMGIDTMDISASAIAALTGPSTTEEGELELPLGISREWFSKFAGLPCGTHIQFSPTTDSCAGWHSFTSSGVNDNTMRRDIIEGMINGTFTTPATQAGVTGFEFIGGNLSTPTFDAMLNLFKVRGCDLKAGTGSVQTGECITDSSGNPVLGATTGRADTVPLLDENGVQLKYPDNTLRNRHFWETTVPVYLNPRDGGGTCYNPNKNLTIVGYARIRLTDVLGAPDKIIVGDLVCDYEEFRGVGGPFYGLAGSLPGLVK